MTTSGWMSASYFGFSMTSSPSRGFRGNWRQFPKPVFPPTTRSLRTFTRFYKHWILSPPFYFYSKNPEKQKIICNHVLMVLRELYWDTRKLIGKILLFPVECDIDGALQRENLWAWQFQETPRESDTVCGCCWRVPATRKRTESLSIPCGNPSSFQRPRSTLLWGWSPPPPPSHHLPPHRTVNPNTRGRYRVCNPGLPDAACSHLLRIISSLARSEVPTNFLTSWSENSLSSKTVFSMMSSDNQSC